MKTGSCVPMRFGRNSQLALVERIESLANEAPGSTAVVDEISYVSYGDLNTRSEDVARYLRSRGVRPGGRVVLLMDKSVDFIVGVLAVWKAGGAYVPLDEDIGPTRLNTVFSDLTPKVILTSPDCNEKFESWSEFVVSLPDARLDASGVGDQELPRIDADDDAYIIYTSGSTGRPNGVPITHAQLQRYIDAIIDGLGLSCGLNYALVSTSAADLGNTVIFSALTTGGCLHIFSKNRSVNPTEFAERMRTDSIDILKITPTHLATLYRYQRTNVLPKSVLIFGGEVLPSVLVQSVIEDGAECSIFNHYGPTEATVGASLMSVDETWNVSSLSTIPIGRPFSGAEFFVLNETLEPVTDGNIGELYIAGPNVTSGYVKRETLNRERFVTIAKNGIGHVRAFKTGDYVKRLPSGDYVFIRRKDDQIKIRGYRVEPGEIENVLRTHPGVRQCAVITQNIEAGMEDVRLCAFMDVDEKRITAPDQGDLDRQRIDKWKRVHDEKYAASPRDADPQFDTNGWISSFTGLPISEAEMREWVYHTVDRIQNLAPKRVLEMGCGSGLLLYRIAPNCEYYHGADFSSQALANLERSLYEIKLANVDLSQREATDFSGLKGHEFDLVVINSLTQHFPSGEYLLDAIMGAVDIVSDTGEVFIGDVRSLPLLELFHCSVARHQSKASMSISEFADRLRMRTAREHELVVDPRYFYKLMELIPGIEDVRIELKRGLNHNEIVNYRYDVTISKGLRTVPKAPPRVLEWGSEGVDIEFIETTLEKDQPPILRVEGVGNARLYDDLFKKDQLERMDPTATVKYWRALECPRQRNDADPEVFWSLAERCGYLAEVTWTPSEYETGQFDVVFTRSRNMRPWNGVERETAVVDKGLPLTNDPQEIQRRRHVEDELRTYLKQKLPGYMIPESIIVLDALPLTANGKIDRRQLSLQLSPKRDSVQVFRAPETETERDLARIWLEILDLDNVGVEDNFFESGGHSLLAAQLIARIQDQWRVNISFTDLFELPTIRDIAERVDGLTERSSMQAEGREELPGESADLVSRCRHVGTSPRVAPISLCQQGLWFLCNLAPKDPRYNVVYRWDLVGQLNEAALEESIGEVFVRHETLRTVFPVKEDGAPVQVVQEGLRFHLDRIDLSERTEEEQVAIIESSVDADMSTPFDLANGPLFEARLFRLGHSRYVLIVRLHHIIFDGWSRGVFLQEVNYLYRCFTLNRPSKLVELPMQYSDFSILQRARMDDQAIAEEVEWWRQKMLGASTETGLIPEQRRSATWQFKGDRQAIDLGPRMSLALQRLCTREDTTMFILLAAVIWVTIRSLTRRRDFIMGADIAGRRERDLEPLIGFFVTQFLLRIKVGDDVPFSDLVAKVKRESTLAFDHQDVPFDQLARALEQRRASNRMPLFEVKLVFQNTSSATLDLAGVQSTLSVDTRTIDCDLVWDLTLVSGSVKGWIKYNPVVLRPDEVECLNARFCAVLEHVIMKPDDKLYNIYDRFDQHNNGLNAAVSGEYARKARERFSEITGRKSQVKL